MLVANIKICKSHLNIRENSDYMISNPDILMTAVNETFGTDFQHQYYTPNTPTNSVYMTQSQTSQTQQKTRSQAIEVLVKELGELKTRVKKLEEDSRQQSHQLLRYHLSRFQSN